MDLHVGSYERSQKRIGVPTIIQHFTTSSIRTCDSLVCGQQHSA